MSRSVHRADGRGPLKARGKAVDCSTPVQIRRQGVREDSGGGRREVLAIDRGVASRLASRRSRPPREDAHIPEAPAMTPATTRALALPFRPSLRLAALPLVLAASVVLPARAGAQADPPCPVLSMPVKWCVVEGAPADTTPAATIDPGRTPDTDEVLWLRHERTSSGSHIPGSSVTFRSAIRILSAGSDAFFPVLPDRRCRDTQTVCGGCKACVGGPTPARPCGADGDCAGGTCGGPECQAVAPPPGTPPGEPFGVCPDTARICRPGPSEGCQQPGACEVKSGPGSRGDVRLPGGGFTCSNDGRSCTPSSPPSGCGVCEDTGAELNRLLNACLRAYELKQPTVGDVGFRDKDYGVAVINARRIVDGRCNAGRSSTTACATDAQCDTSTGSDDGRCGRVAAFGYTPYGQRQVLVEDNAFTYCDPSDPARNTFNSPCPGATPGRLEPEDLVDANLGHELGHALFIPGSGRRCSPGSARNAGASCTSDGDCRTSTSPNGFCAERGLVHACGRCVNAFAGLPCDADSASCGGVCSQSSGGLAGTPCVNTFECSPGTCDFIGKCEGDNLMWPGRQDVNDDGFLDNLRIAASIPQVVDSKRSKDCLLNATVNPPFNDQVFETIDQGAALYAAVRAAPGCKIDGAAPPNDSCALIPACTLVRQGPGEPQGTVADLEVDAVGEVTPAFLDLSVLFVTEPGGTGTTVFGHQLFGTFTVEAAEFDELAYFVLADLDDDRVTGGQPDDLLDELGIATQFGGVDLVARVLVEVEVAVAGGDPSALLDVVGEPTVWKFDAGSQSFVVQTDPDIDARVVPSAGPIEGALPPDDDDDDDCCDDDCCGACCIDEAPARDTGHAPLVVTGVEFGTPTPTPTSTPTGSPGTPESPAPTPGPGDEVHSADTVVIELPNEIRGEIALPFRVQVILRGIRGEEEIVDRFEDDAEGREVAPGEPVFPSCEVLPNPTVAGGPARVRASGLLPKEMVKVNFDDGPACTGPAPCPDPGDMAGGQADPQGAADIGFTVPAGAAAGLHLVTAGSRFEGTATALTADCTVDVRVPGAEICANCLDDDVDGLIDCEDPDCQPCPTIEPVPGRARIRFATGRFEVGGHDQLVLHKAVIPGVLIDPPNEDVGVVLTNALGLVFRDRLAAGRITQKGRFRFDYRNLAARRMRRGIARLTIQERPSRGHFRLTLEAYGDLRAATEPEMTLQIKIGDDVFVKTAAWARSRTGWTLRVP
jgi:hypothetical protein